MSQPVVAIVVAAGLGLRYGGSKPKPTLRVLGRTVVGIAVEALAAGGCTDAVVVINSTTSHLFKAALQGLPIPVTTAYGGDTRQESVRRGLDIVRKDPYLSQASVILVHDAVRPMVPAYVTEAVIEAVQNGAVAVAPSIPVSDTMRMTGDDGSTHLVDRTWLQAVQTPQGFRADVLLACHDCVRTEGLQFTDDVSCCEHYGHPVTLVPGSRMALKITEPADLHMVRALWLARASLGHHSGRRLWRRNRHR